MERNFYFTYWMARYSKEEFSNLATKMCRNVEVPKEVKEKNETDEYIFHYFYALYSAVALDFFGLNSKQIEMCFDLMITVGCSKLYPPAELLEKHKDVVPEILEYVKKDFLIYSSKEDK